MTKVECSCCGKEFPRLSPARIEGAIIDVCDRCSKFGTKIGSVNTEYKAIRKPMKILEMEDENFELVPEYGKLISEVRESKGLSRYDFAKKLNEKESIVKRLEDEELEPNFDLVKRIEDLLDVRLRGRYEGIVLKRVEKKRPLLTVGDIVEVS